MGLNLGSTARDEGERETTEARIPPQKSPDFNPSKSHCRQKWTAALLNGQYRRETTTLQPGALSAHSAFDA